MLFRGHLIEGISALGACASQRYKKNQHPILESTWENPICACWDWGFKKRYLKHRVLYFREPDDIPDKDMESRQELRKNFKKNYHLIKRSESREYHDKKGVWKRGREGERKVKMCKRNKLAGWEQKNWKCVREQKCMGPFQFHWGINYVCLQERFILLVLNGQN